MSASGQGNGNSPQQAIRAVVFDLDGLMFNTETVFNQTSHIMLERRGKRATPELFRRMMGRRAQEALAAMIEVMDLSDTIQELQEESVDTFFSLIDDHLAPMPGLFELLGRIEARGLPKAVATSSTRPYVENILGRFQLMTRFDSFMTAEDVTHGKPHPEIYVKSADRLSIGPQHMMVLEDSQAGTEAAAAAGAYIISVPHEHSRHHDFSRARAVAERLDDPVILDLL